MSNDFERELDESIDLLVQGGSVAECLARFPEHAEELESMLSTFSLYANCNTFVPSLQGKTRGKTKLEESIQSSDEPGIISLLQNALKRPLVWAPVAAVVLVIVICAGLGMFSFSGDQNEDGTTVVTAQPTQTPVIASMGTLEIRITDAPAYDITEVNMIISNLQALRTGSTANTNGQSEWQMVFEGSTSFELLELRDSEKVIAFTKIKAGHYSQLRNNLDQVTLEVNGDVLHALLQSGISSIASDFVITSGGTTTLVIDIDADESITFTPDGYVVFDPVMTVYASYHDSGDDRVVVGESYREPKWIPIPYETTGDKGEDTDRDHDGVDDLVDTDPENPYVCQDIDSDGCDDCSIGRDHCGPMADNDPNNDGIDTDRDGICNKGDDDDDNDGVLDIDDIDPLDPDVCQDIDNDGCDDCAVGTDDLGPLADNDPNNDGIDTDGDGKCDAGDPDDDNDGVNDATDDDPLNPDICRDSDNDGCDDCSQGTDDFGPFPDYDPANDGADSDGDGICDLTDPRDDNQSDSSGTYDDSEGDGDGTNGDEEDDGDSDKGHGNDDDGSDEDNPGKKQESDNSEQRTRTRDNK